MIVAQPEDADAQPGRRRHTAPALAAFEHPAREHAAPGPPNGDADGALEFVRARHVAPDGDGWMVATYVRTTGVAPDDEAARAAILDSLACAIAGRNEPVAQRLRTFALARSSGGAATLWGTGEKVPAELAARAIASR